MGQMKRAEARERRLRKNLESTHRVILAWTPGPDHDFLLDVLEPHTRRPLTRQRVIEDAKTILGMVDRTLCAPTQHGPAGILLRKNLEKRAGEIEVEISGEQFMRMTSL